MRGASICYYKREGAHDEWQLIVLIYKPCLLKNSVIHKIARAREKKSIHLHHCYKSQVMNNSENVSTPIHLAVMLVSNDK